MHELALAGAVIDTAERHASGRRILLVRLRLGELRQVVPDSLGCTTCDATWDLSATPGSPSATWGQTPPGGARPRLSFRCPQCGSADVGVRSGNEFEVESIEVEEPACTG